MVSADLQIIPIIAKTKSFSKAAKMLHLSQPAISSKVQTLEDYYNAKFFHRTSQGVELTEAGQLIYEYASSALNLHSDFENRLNKLKDDLNSQDLTIASSCIGAYSVPNIICEFKKKSPHTNIVLTVSSRTEALENLEKEKADIAIVDGPLDSSIQANFELLVLQTQELLLIAANNSSMKDIKNVSLNQLQKLPFIITEQGSPIRIAIENYLHAQGLELEDFNVFSEMNNIASIKTAVESGYAISVLPYYAIEQELKSKTIKTLYLTDGPRVNFEFCLVYKKDKLLSPIANKYIKFVSSLKGCCLGWDLN